MTVLERGSESFARVEADVRSMRPINELLPIRFHGARPITSLEASCAPCDRVMPAYMHPDTAAVLRENYDYIFGADPYPGAANVQIDVVEGPFSIPSRYDDSAPVSVDPILLHHGSTPVYGYRIGRFAYLTDVSEIPEASYDGLDGVDVLVLDALRPRPHPTHFSFDEAVAVARRIGAQQTYFVHMTHNVRHAEANARLPDDVQLAYDGLTVEVPALAPSEAAS